MKVIQLGEKFNEKYDFRETCFGIVKRGNKMLVVNKQGQYSLIGGGIEKGESFEECLKREFLEESGYHISKIRELIRIDCYWLAANKYPMLSKANIFEVEVSLDNIDRPLENDCKSEWIDVNSSLDLLPLPYHKEAVKYYMQKKDFN